MFSGSLCNKRTLPYSYIYDDDGSYNRLLIFLSVFTLNVLLFINRFTKSLFEEKHFKIIQRLTYSIYEFEGRGGYYTSNGCRMTGILLLQNSKLKVTHKIFTTDFYPCLFVGRGPEVMLKLISKTRRCSFHLELRLEICPLFERKWIDTLHQFKCTRLSLDLLCVIAVAYWAVVICLLALLARVGLEIHIAGL